MKETASEVHIPGYVIKQILGKGGMAVVYRAEQTSLERNVAVKVLSPEAFIDSSSSDRFLKETRILANFNHSNIVSIYDAGKTNENYYYLSMECLDGGGLGDRIHRGLTFEQSIGVIKNIAQALSAAHNRGFIHRDIKPDNIMFRSKNDYMAVLTDFGIAREISPSKDQQLTAVRAMIGSPPYMSPEQSMAEKLDQRSDLFSLGVVLYYCLTRSLPYDATSIAALWESHKTIKTPELPASSVIFQPLIAKLLAIDPGERFQSAKALLRSIDELEITDIKSISHSIDKTIVATQKQQIEKTENFRPSQQPKKKFLVATVVIFFIVSFIIFFGLFDIGSDEINVVEQSAISSQVVDSVTIKYKEGRSKAAGGFNEALVSSNMYYNIIDQVELIPDHINIAVKQNGTVIDDYESLPKGVYQVSLSAPAYKPETHTVTVPGESKKYILSYQNNISELQFWHFQQAMKDSRQYTKFIEAFPNSPFIPVLDAVNNPEKILPILIKRAEQGNAAAQFQLSELYDLGVPSLQEGIDAKKEALAWAEKSAEAEYHLGKFQFAMMLLRDNNRQSEQGARAVNLLNALSREPGFIGKYANRVLSN